MTDLIETCPEAQRFVDEAIRELEATYGPSMRFSPAVVWTNFVLPDGEVCGGTEPEQLVRSITGHGIAILNEHDHTRPLGWMNRARYFDSPPSGVPMIVGVIGFYEPAQTPTFDDVLTEDAHVEVLFEPIPEEPSVLLSAHHRELAIEEIRALVRGAPEEVERFVRREFRHSESDSVQQLTVWLPAAMLLGAPFLTRLSQVAADKAAAVLGWLRTSVVGHLAGKQLSRPVFELKAVYRECSVQFIVKSNAAPVLLKALDSPSRHTAAIEACRTIEYLYQRGILLDRLICRYDEASSTWVVLYAIRKDGRPIVRQRDLIVAQGLSRGLSLGGVYPDPPETVAVTTEDDLP